VADEEYRAGIAGHEFLQKIQRLHVEIVGRLVEHQEVRRRDSTRARMSRARSPPDSSRTGVAPVRG
jgi:hypothetical protein